MSKIEPYSIAGHSILPGNLTAFQIRELLFLKKSDSVELRNVANDIRKKYYLNSCYFRAVIEISNACDVNCQYCSMQRDNIALNRYEISFNCLESAMSKIREIGIKTIMFQAGEKKSNYDFLVKYLQNYNLSDLNILVSIGNLSLAQIKVLKNLGVSGVLLKFETLNEEVFFNMQGRSLSNRIKSILNIKKQDLQISSGSILGLPGQSNNDLISELLFLQYLNLPMHSVSPFIPSHNTKYENYKKPKLDLVLNYIALLRIINPDSLIPSVSALNMIENEGQLLGLRSGANVLTLNFTPNSERENFTIYDESRRITDCEFGNKLVREQNLEVNYGWALGPKYLGSIESDWFKNRYRSDNYNMSVYGESSEFFINSFIPLLKKKHRIVDLGGGDGRNSISIVNKVKEIDIIDKNITAITRFKKIKTFLSIQKINAIHMDIMNLDDLEKYTCFILSNVIYYFDKESMIGLIERILKVLNKVNNKYLYLSFETNISMRKENNNYFQMSGLYNYTIEDINTILLKFPDTYIFKKYISTHEKKIEFPNNYNNSTHYIRSFISYEIIITRK